MPTTAVRRRRRFPAISVVALVVFGLLLAWFIAAIAHAAAPTDSFIIPESDIPKTSCSDPYSQVSVTELAQQHWTSCDMEGHVVVFPDGITAQVGDVGAITGPTGDGGPLPENFTYVVENLGRYGVIAVRETGGKKEYWGSDRGVERLKQTRSGV